MIPRCLRCKGRGFCGRISCPIYAKAEAMFQLRDMNIGEQINSSSYSVFVGSRNYPKLNLGILAPPERKPDNWMHDAPLYWSSAGVGINDIINLRSSLVNSRFRTDVSVARKGNRTVELCQEIAMASRPADVDISLKKRPRVRLNLDPELMPMGPAASLTSAELISNPHIPTKIDRIVSDTDLKASEGLRSLYFNNTDEHTLTKLLSVGTLGMKKNRKLVPTRNSITAVDDNIGRRLIELIKDHPESNHMAFYGSYLGNTYLIMFFPEPWGYELFECYLPRAGWNTSASMQFMTDYEPYTGRTSYAESCAGGYYAARLAVLEKLKGMKRQASVLALRFIDGSYWCPLGVWVVREAVRKTLAGKPIEFSSSELMLHYARIRAERSFGYDADNMLKKSLLIRNIKTQRKLSAFM
ncbi:TPA: hypothetical protein HA317_00945 [Candidatus Woesearchaeota archaeon]|nr:hypothetical protein [Candidatus Woesearchaeota archaeon]